MKRGDDLQLEKERKEISPLRKEPGELAWRIISRNVIYRFSSARVVTCPDT